MFRVGQAGMQQQHFSFRGLGVVKRGPQVTGNQQRRHRVGVLAHVLVKVRQRHRGVQKSGQVQQAVQRGVKGKQALAHFNIAFGLHRFRDGFDQFRREADPGAVLVHHLQRAPEPGDQRFRGGDFVPIVQKGFPAADQHALHKIVLPGREEAGFLFRALQHQAL